MISLLIFVMGMNFIKKKEKERWCKPKKRKS